jgi:hypothetical protein
MRPYTLSVASNTREDTEISFIIKNLVGAQGRNRTTDTVIFSHMLYQLSYLGLLPTWALDRRS